MTVFVVLGAIHGWKRGSRKLAAQTAKRPAVPTGRKPIPVVVRREVWRRDQGACVDCGSRERLEYDHIVPVIRGGANTVRNIELRCERCNRSKGAKV
jgi:5-methylcytosine-specific restriction endonuclease McrA